MKMKGWYTITDGDGNTVASDNIITSVGEGLIMLYMSGEQPTWAAKFSIGGGETAAAAGDQYLEYPYNHVLTSSYVADTTLKTVTAKATLGQNIAGVIYELGVWNLGVNPTQPSDFIKIVDYNQDIVEAGTGISADSTNYRMGSSSVNVNADSDGTTAQILNISQDLSTFDTTDEFVFGYYTKDANVADCEIRLMNNANDYYKYNFAPNTSVGFHILTIPKSSFSAVNSGSWSGITEINTIVKATGATTTDFMLDGLVIRDTDTYSNYGLVSHSILGSPVTKPAGQDYEITYTVEFTQ